MKTPQRTLSAAITLLALAGLLSPAQAQDDEAVATVAGKPITVADVEAGIESQLAELEKQRQILIEGAVGPAIDRRLVEAEAEARGVTADELLETEVTAKIPPVTEADIATWYEENKTRLAPGTTLGQVSGQIGGFLQQDRGQSVFRDFIASLRGKYETKIFFEPPRTAIDVSDATWKGPENAPITLVEFSDFQCPACKGFNPTVSRLLELYPQDVKVAFLQFPLHSIHPQAQGAAEASLCARDGGKFWQLHDEMFANQRNLGLEDLKAAARKVGLDGETFDACLDSNKYAPTVQADVDRAAGAGATGTPAVFINGRVVSPGRVPTLEALATVVEDELRRTQSAGL